MTTPTTAFFDRLAQRGHEHVLEGTSGTVRVELADGTQRERWLVSVHDGDVSVSHGDAAPDCTLRTDRSTFGDVVSGNANAMASVLRGTIEVEGDWALLLAFQRVFPQPVQDAAIGARR